MVRGLTDQQIFQMSKDELLLPARSESSCSLQSRDLLASSSHSLESSNISPELGLEPHCDSSSEVSDEGYKSSQGNVSSKTGATPGLLTTTTTQEDGDRPVSSMTVGSDCSSTISSEDEDQTSSSHLEDQDGSSSLTIIAVTSPARKYELILYEMSSSLYCARSESSQACSTEETTENQKEEGIKKSASLSPTTKNRLANLFNRIPKFGKDRKEAEQDTPRNDRVSSSAKINPSPAHSSTR